MIVVDAKTLGISTADGVGKPLAFSTILETSELTTLAVRNYSDYCSLIDGGYFLDNSNSPIEDYDVFDMAKTILEHDEFYLVFRGGKFIVAFDTSSVQENELVMHDFGIGQRHPVVYTATYGAKALALVLERLNNCL